MESFLRSLSHFLLVSIIPLILILSGSGLWSWECWNSRICSLLHAREKETAPVRTKEIYAGTVPEMREEVMGRCRNSHS